MINWLDPEPSSDNSDYEIYVEELQRIEKRINCFKGFYQPSTEEEYHNIRTRESEEATNVYFRLIFTSLHKAAARTFNL